MLDSSWGNTRLVPAVLDTILIAGISRLYFSEIRSSSLHGTHRRKGFEHHSLRSEYWSSKIQRSK